jgi:shikimate dehydrogenase
MIYAEVIGDPVAQSKSPLIHKYWLNSVGLAGDYLATQVSSTDLASFLELRRADQDWRGCTVTIPHKQSAIDCLDDLDCSASAVGAVNCVVRAGERLIGVNTDLDGNEAALGTTSFAGRDVVVIGAGGAARAALAYLAKRKPGRIVILVRDPMKAKSLRELAPVQIAHLAEADALLPGASAIINASPLGMAGATQMSPQFLAAVARSASGATIFDMVYKPLETQFLAAGRAGGGRTVNGLTMLVGQAARAFEMFFGHPAPPPDKMLSDLLTTGRQD